LQTRTQCVYNDHAQCTQSIRMRCTLLAGLCGSDIGGTASRVQSLTQCVLISRVRANARKGRNRANVRSCTSEASGMRRDRSMEIAKYPRDFLHGERFPPPAAVSAQPRREREQLPVPEPKRVPSPKHLCAHCQLLT